MFKESMFLILPFGFIYPYVRFKIRGSKARGTKDSSIVYKPCAARIKGRPPQKKATAVTMAELGAGLAEMRYRLRIGRLVQVRTR